MFLTDRKLERRITELQEYRYRDIIRLEKFAVKEDTGGVVNPALPTSFEGGIPCAQEIPGRDATVSCGCIRKSRFRQSGRAERLSEFLTLEIPVRETTPALNPCCT